MMKDRGDDNGMCCLLPVENACFDFSFFVVDNILLYNIGVVRMRKILRQTQHVAMFVCPASMDPTNKVQGERIDHQLGSIYIIYISIYRSVVISLY